MIKLIKPKFWDKKNKNFISIVLYPLSMIVLLIIFLKKLFVKERDFKIPIICVGNIYIGGTGKTPTSIFIAKELLSLGLNTVILRKYYKNHSDEYNLITNNFENLIVNKDRAQGIIDARKKGFKTLILDDGLQDYRIKSNLKIVCFNQKQLIGNGLVLPAGPLRESLSALKKVDIILINGNKDIEFEKKLLSINKNLDIHYSYYKPKNIDEFYNHKLLAIAGIANPENFFNLLKENNLKINKKLIFPDHYKFNKSELLDIINEAEKEKLKIIMTEKDFNKVNDFRLEKINYLKVSLEIENQEKFFKRIMKLYV